MDTFEFDSGLHFSAGKVHLTPAGFVDVQEIVDYKPGGWNGAHWKIKGRKIAVGEHFKWEIQDRTSAGARFSSANPFNKSIVSITVVRVLNCYYDPSKEHSVSDCVVELES